MPTFGYVVSGTVAVETDNRQVVLLHAGQAEVEVKTTVHRGKAVGGAVEIPVFCADAVGVANTLAPSASVLLGGLGRRAATLKLNSVDCQRRNSPLK